MIEEPRSLKFDQGSMWEEYPWEIVLDAEIWRPKRCPHCGPIYTQRTTRTDGTFFDTDYCRCPRVVIAYNEGSYATTGVCLDCIIEAAKGLSL